MTGTEPFIDPGVRPKLRWRAGRYSLSRLFLNFYLLVMGSFVAIAFFADIVISTALKGITDDYARRFMRGTIVLIEDELFRHPQATWPEQLELLDDRFSYHLDITERARLKLPAKQLEKLDYGGIAIDHEGEIMYYRLRDSGQVLVVGPLSPDRNQEMQSRGIPLELRIRLLTWSVIGLCFAIALWFWIRPIWRDLETLRQTARSLGEGKLETRSPEAHSKLFAPLADTLNGMAERVQRLLAMQKDLSSAISHELRTPIARLRFATEMLAEAEEKPERERLSLMMERDLEELDKLVDSSLVYAKLERENRSLHLVTVVLDDWLEEQIEGIRFLAGHVVLKLRLDDLPDGTTVTMDPKVMLHAFSNLLRNAIKYTRSEVVVSARCGHERVSIFVDDDGIGIPPDERERIFTAFTRLDRSRDRATGGYGLGLAIARSALELHGGEARAESSPQGGARFILSWPIHTA
jgi:signal transduction histidine kinase